MTKYNYICISSYIVTEQLTDARIVFLSERIASEDELVKLGITGLKLEFPQIQRALTNHPKDIQSAVRDVLRTWLKKQRDTNEAWSLMIAALEKCEMKDLATGLKVPCHIRPQKDGISKERVCTF